MLAVWVAVVAVGVAPVPGARAAEGEAGPTRAIGYGGCEPEWVSNRLMSCKDVHCDGICVMHRWPNDPLHTLTVCFCDLPNMHGTEPGASN